MACPHGGSSSIGMKMPLMKTRGSLIIDDIIITLAGVSDGGYADNTMLKEAKQKVPRTTPNPRIKGLTISTPIIMLTAIGKIETSAPKRKEDSTSPRKMVHREIGEDTSLSRVLALASHGTIAGPTEVDVKNAVIPNKPGMRASAGIFRPM